MHPPFNILQNCVFKLIQYYSELYMIKNMGKEISVCNIVSCGLINLFSLLRIGASDGYYHGLQPDCEMIVFCGT